MYAIIVQAISAIIVVAFAVMVTVRSVKERKAQESFREALKRMERTYG